MVYKKWYYEANREKHNLKSRADYQKHRDKRLATLREKRANRTDEQKAEDNRKSREYYIKNRDRLNQLSREKYAEQKANMLVLKNKLETLEAEGKDNES